MTLAPGFITTVGDPFQLAGGGDFKQDFDNIEDGDILKVGGFTFEYNFVDTGADSIFLETVAIPEPASLALLGVGSLFMLGRSRRA